jgi:hypothetical protein
MRFMPLPSNLLRHRIGHCPHCGKWTFLSRKTARRAARVLHLDAGQLQAYRCPRELGKWHYGHRRDSKPASGGTP